jgi:hypothetical protein
MKNEALRTLNFSKLLDYNNGPPTEIRYKYEPEETRCSRYCVSCDQGFPDLLNEAGMKLWLMSHAADTSDFEAFFKTQAPINEKFRIIDEPIMFLLESPGADYCNGIPKEHADFPHIEKNPPVYVYYWMPHVRRQPNAKWPTEGEAREVAGTYGDYFAYLIAHFNLRNAYITNTVKCNLRKDGRNAFVRPKEIPESLRSKIVQNCYQLFLSKEKEELNPAIVFAFGESAHKNAKSCGLSKLSRFPLLHPACLNLGKWKGKNYEFISENNARVERALSEIMS